MSVRAAANDGLLVSTATYTPGTYVTATYNSTVVVAHIMFLCATPAVASHTSITCSSPRGVFSKLHVMVAIYGLQSALTDDAVVGFPPPSIEALTPDQVPTAGAFNVSISGRHMGPDPAVTVATSFTSDATVKWPLNVQLGRDADGGGPCVHVFWVSDEHVICTVAAGYGGPHDVIVTVGDQTATAAGLFRYSPPAIHIITPAFLPFPGGGSVEILGANFFPGCVDNKFRTRPCDQSWLSSKSDPLASLTHVHIGN